MGEYHGKIVHTSGSIGRRGVGKGAICRTCPSGCKTDCLRAGIRDESSHTGYDFDKSFADAFTYGVETSDALDDF